MNSSLAVLRDRQSGAAEFRRAARNVCDHLMQKIRLLLDERGIDGHDIVIAIVLRSGIAFLDSAVEMFPNAPVGVLGLKRNEKTLDPSWYYENLPPITKDKAIVLLDPMLATGGSAQAAVEKLAKQGADPSNVYFVGIVAAPEGVSRLASMITRENIILAAIDDRLDQDGMITPGVGDFGDRYFGYEGHAKLGA